VVLPEVEPDVEPEPLVLVPEVLLLEPRGRLLLLRRLPEEVLLPLVEPLEPEVVLIEPEVEPDMLPLVEP
jgi:hypothetical protein